MARNPGGVEGVGLPVGQDPPRPQKKVVIKEGGHSQKVVIEDGRHSQKAPAHGKTGKDQAEMATTTPVLQTIGLSLSSHGRSQFQLFGRPSDTTSWYRFLLPLGLVGSASHARILCLLSGFLEERPFLPAH